MLQWNYVQIKVQTLEKQNPKTYKQKKPPMIRTYIPKCRCVLI